MVVLGIETSCDETSAAVVSGSGDDVAQKSLVILSQDVHRIFGGVVPEIASRAHVTAIVPVVDQALREANIALDDVDVVAVTNAPGLVGALLVGVSYAKGLAFGSGKRVLGVHHMEGHLFAQSLEHPNAVPPFTALLVSGGHTLLIDVPAWGDYDVLGATRDDAAGEAFDKVAKLLGLPYPGGRHIERIAREGDPSRFRFARPMLRRNQQPGDDDYLRRFVQRPQDRGAARGARVRQHRARRTPHCARIPGCADRHAGGEGAAGGGAARSPACGARRRRRLQPGPRRRDSHEAGRLGRGGVRSIGAARD